MRTLVLPDCHHRREVHQQIFGHTRQHKPINIGTDWCIDTDSRHYAIVEDGNIKLVMILIERTPE